MGEQRVVSNCSTTSVLLGITKLALNIPVEIFFLVELSLTPQANLMSQESLLLITPVLGETLNLSSANEIAHQEYGWPLVT